MAKTSNYARNKARSMSRTTKPTKTDQAQAKDTDINVIVKRHAVTGTAPGAPTPAQYGDFSQVPMDLRSIIETARSFNRLRLSLPQELKNLSQDELLALTPAELAQKLTPADTPAPTPAPQPEGEKK